MDLNHNIIIAGGGLAGLTAAIHLLKAGLKVTVIEKNAYPHHKVCGEYISNEVVPYLVSLGAYPAALHPTQISKFQFSSTSGKLISAPLPLGGFGLSRYAFDHFLMKRAIENGCQLIQDAVLHINFTGNEFDVQTARHGHLKSPVVLGAYGKRTTLDHKLNRPFIRKPSPWLAVKAHYLGQFDENLVALHHFKGGYCGVSRVENSRINICYLTDYVTFKKYRSLEEFQQQVLFENKHLKSIFQNSTMEFEVPLTIGQISFEKKEPVKDHIMMIGDAAGLIHPLCGNGMSMAIHSAKICAEQVVHYLSGGTVSRAQMEQTYSQLWKHHFKERMLMGRLLAALLRKEKLADFMTSSLVNFPSILPQLIKRTHGYPL
jgi:flavin-dependent dehydrogenase